MLAPFSVPFNMRLCDTPNDALWQVVQFVKPRDRHALRSLSSALRALPPVPDTRLRVSVRNWLTRLGRSGADAEVPHWAMQAKAVELCANGYTENDAEPVLRLCRCLSQAGLDPDVVCVYSLDIEPDHSHGVVDVFNEVARSGPWRKASLELRNTRHWFSFSHFCAEARARLAWCDAVLYWTAFELPFKLRGLKNIVLWKHANVNLDLFPALEVLEAPDGGFNPCAYQPEVAMSSERCPLPRIVSRLPNAVSPLNLPAPLNRFELEAAVLNRPESFTPQAMRAKYLAITVNDRNTQWLVSGALALPNVRVLRLGSAEGGQSCRDAAAAVLRAAPRLRKLVLLDGGLLSPAVLDALPDSVSKVDITTCYVPPALQPAAVATIVGNPPRPRRSAVTVCTAQPWDLRGLDDPGPQTGVQCSIVRITSWSFVSQARFLPPAGAAAWTLAVRVVEFGDALGTAFACCAGQLAAMFPRIHTLSAMGTSGLQPDELPAVRELMLALGPRLRRVNGTPLLPLRDAHDVRGACPWVEFA